jgi:hypothetical protein
MYSFSKWEARSEISFMVCNAIKEVRFYIFHWSWMEMDLTLMLNGWMVDDLVKFFIDITKSFEFVHQIFSIGWKSLVSTYIHNLTHFFIVTILELEVQFTLLYAVLTSYCMLKR